MKADGLVSDFAFTGNPIILREAASSVSDLNPGKFYVQYGHRKIYEGRLDPSLPLEVNVADIINSAVEVIPEIPDGYEPVVMVEDMEALNHRRAYASFSWDNAETEFECFSFPGGIPRQNFRTYLRHGVDAFSARFLNRGCNFFLTTRSVDWFIPIKETELTPLYFICNSTGALKIIERCRNKEWLFDRLDWGVFALDLNALRWEFFDEFDTLPSDFDIYRDDMYSCRIVITKVDPSKEHYRVKFRNSLGVFDIIDLVGVAKVSMGDETDDETDYKKYDHQIDDYCVERMRLSLKQSFTVDCVLNPIREMMLLQDMLASDEVYLLDITECPVKVIPKCDDLSYNIRPSSPQKISVIFTPSDTDDFVLEKSNKLSYCNRSSIKHNK